MGCSTASFRTGGIWLISNDNLKKRGEVAYMQMQEDHLQSKEDYLQSKSLLQLIGLFPLNVGQKKLQRKRLPGVLSSLVFSSRTSGSMRLCLLGEILFFSSAWLSFPIICLSFTGSTFSILDCNFGDECFANLICYLNNKQ